MTTAIAPQATRTDPVVPFVKGVNWAFFAGALAVSFLHIVAVFSMLGLDDWQHWVTPLPVDGLLVLGRIGMSPRFAESTQKAGRRLFLSMLALSFTANVAAGLDSVGGMVWGGLVIMGLVITEWYGPKLLPAPVPELTPGQKGAATRRRNAEIAAAAKANRRTQTRKAKAPARQAKTVVAKTDLDAELKNLLG